MNLTFMNPKELQILTQLEKGIPLVTCPFKVLAEKLNISEREFLFITKKLLKEKKIRRIGAIINSKALGFASTLIATQIKEEQIPTIIPIINSYPEVTHNYLRLGKFNLWFTIIAKDRLTLAKIIEEISKKTNLYLYSLPTVKVFKLSLEFLSKSSHPPPYVSNKEPISNEERCLLKVITDLPILPNPWEWLATELRVTEKEVLNKLSQLIQKGIIRKIRAVLSPSAIGLLGNALVVWQVKEEDLDKWGNFFASLSVVSHCYARSPHPEIPFNLYTMMHFPCEEKLKERVNLLTNQIKPIRKEILFTLKDLLSLKRK